MNQKTFNEFIIAILVIGFAVIIIQNQMITNNLLNLLVASNCAGALNNRLLIANKLDECADDIVKARLAFEKLAN